MAASRRQPTFVEELARRRQLTLRADAGAGALHCHIQLGGDVSVVVLLDASTPDDRCAHPADGPAADGSGKAGVRAAQARGERGDV